MGNNTTGIWARRKKGPRVSFIHGSSSWLLYDPPMEKRSPKSPLQQVETLIIFIAGCQRRVGANVSLYEAPPVTSWTDFVSMRLFKSLLKCATGRRGLGSVHGIKKEIKIWRLSWALLVGWGWQVLSKWMWGGRPHVTANDRIINDHLFFIHIIL